MAKNYTYTPEPLDKADYTERFDQAYSRFATLYDLVVRWLPLWRHWISQALPYIYGPQVLEISFGTGYLLTQYADKYQTYGVDYNWELSCLAQQKLQEIGAQAFIQQADVEYLPYRSACFDTVVNTMAFTGYPDGHKAMAEIHRVIKKGGRLVLIDVNYPHDGNWLGLWLTRFWASAGDIIREMDHLLEHVGFDYSEREVGGFGSVHLYIATKRS